MATEQQGGESPRVVIAGWALDYPIPAWGLASGQGARNVADAWAKGVLSTLAAAGYTVARTETIQNEQDYASSLRADLDLAQAAIKAVREVHRRDDMGDCPTCSHEIGPGGGPGGRWDCAHTDRIVQYPCPTVTAINDAFTVVSPPHVREWLRRTAPDGEVQGG